MNQENEWKKKEQLHINCDELSPRHAIFTTYMVTHESQIRPPELTALRINAFLLLPP
jgi:hypothetical protein